MNSSYICLVCRQRLGQVGRNRLRQCRPKAHIASFTSSNLRPSADNLQDIESPIPHFDNGKDSRIYDSQRDKGSGYRDVLVSLFEASLKPQRQSTASEQQFMSLKLYNNVETLKNMLKDAHSSVADSWAFFSKHFGPDARRDESIQLSATPSYLQTTGRTLLKQIIQAKSEIDPTQSLPTISEVVRVYHTLGMLDGFDWIKLMYGQLEAILEEKSWSSTKQILLVDLMESWNIVCSKKWSNRSREGAQIKRRTLPQKIIDQSIQRHGPNGPFGALLPSFSIRQLDGIALIAAATYALLVQPDTPRNLSRQIRPLLAAFSQIFSSGHVQIQSLISSSVPSVLSDILKQQDFENLFASRESHSFIGEHLSLQKRLHDAFARRDIHLVDKLWVEMTAADSAGEAASRPTRYKNNASTYNYFIMSYMALRISDKAIEAWNHMMEHDILPTLATWDSMMVGCKIARDAKALEMVWNRMLSLGVHPDACCWTTRIGGLIECNQSNEAIQALDEMAREWMAAIKSEHPTIKDDEVLLSLETAKAVKPNITTINAALSGLLRKRESGAAHKVLAWAGQFGISPDIVTYNTLLRGIARDQNFKDVMLLLEQMQSQGIEADAATFTTILDGTFSRNDSNPPSEHKLLINKILNEMKSVGIKPNLHTYGKVIYQLIQLSKKTQSNDDFQLVDKTLDTMRSEGLRPSRYINTILLEHYFERDPPDLAAVHTLTERVHNELGSGDYIFWDRVIEGYARIGDTAAAMRVLERVSTGGRKARAGWNTLETLLGALATRDDWDAARALVRNAAAENGGPLMPDEKGLEGQHRFWLLVGQLKLMW